MREILEGIAYEANIAGVEAEVVDDVFPDVDDAVYVVIPHEYFALADPAIWPTAQQLGRTFALTVEHPGTQWFEISSQQARRCAAIIDINLDSTAELRRRWQPATHFQLGYSEYYDIWHGVDNERSTDILYLGSTDTKRDRSLAGYAPLWWDKHVKLLVPGHEPKTASGKDFLAGEQKLELLRDSRILVNLHRDRSQSLEWVRVLEGMSNGCVVFSEHSVDAAPLRAQEHFLSASPESLGIMAANALDDDGYLAEVRHRAYDFIRRNLRLSTSVERLLEEAEALLAAPREVPGTYDVPIPGRGGPRPPAWAEFSHRRDHTEEALSRLEIKSVQLSRSLGLAHAELRELRGAQPEPPRSTPVHSGAIPDVSVIVPAYNMSRHIVECLDSVVASRSVAFEILVRDDASTDDTRAVVLDYMQKHPDVPILLTSSPSNRGLAATRNALLEDARAEYIFSLDPDNGIYPTALERLKAALDDDPEAAFAYSILATFAAGRPQNLVSSREWDPALFRYGNYIDNMSMLRASAVRSVGGWDPALPNWEDFHLWVRFAERGLHAVFLPEMLCWYRASPYSMSQEVVLHRPQIWASLRTAAPSILVD
jgi:hypothetical protein